MQINLEWFRTFKAIYETGTLSAAAQELFISQPGVSLHLNSLEAFTGYKLFDRSPRKMVPTEKGKLLYNFILEPIRKLETAEQHFHRRTQSERVTISLGMCFESFQHTLEEYIPKLPFNLIIKFGQYPQMQQDLESGLLDMIVTPQKGSQKGLQYQPFSKERIVLIAGNDTDIAALTTLFENDEIEEARNFLKQQLWYSTAGDMEHLKNFWIKNFNEHPDFSPNFIVPNITSIVRCLSNGDGFSIVPDFLCSEALQSGRVKLVWQGKQPMENILYFGTREKTIYENELQQLKKLFEEKWELA
jgi:DNA-binding transcriptional LysR family regulator